MDPEQAEPPRPNRRGQGEEISVRDIWLLLRARWLLILISMGVCGTLATIAAFLSPPIYRGEVLLMPAEANLDSKSRSASPLGDLASLAGLGSSSSTKEEAMAILQSRTLTDRFVQENQLLPVLFDKSWDVDGQRWKVEDPKKIPTLWDAYKLISRIRKISEDRKTGLITVTVDWKDPKLAAQWANELVRRTNDYMRSTALQRSAANVTYLKDQLEKTGVVEIRTSINNLIEEELKKSMLASGSGEYAFQVIDPAVVPQEKISPKRLFHLLAGLILGLVLGILIAFVKTLP